jgi:hypothetical protein
MAITMKDVRAALDPDEPKYAEAAKLGSGALTHLEALVSAGDPMLASKATYLASLIRDARSAAIVEKAARSENPAVRVAAATAASNLPAAGAAAVLLELVSDADPGVRKVARRSVPDKPSGKLAEKLKAAPEAPGEAATAREGGPVLTGLMPGETGRSATMGGTGSAMPGEQPGAMPGEQQKMPGE